MINKKSKGLTPELVRKALAEMESKQREEWRNFVASLLKPLKDKRAELVAMRREIDGQIEAIDEEIAALESKPSRAAGVTRKRRRTSDELKTDAAGIVAMIKASKSGLTGGDIHKKYPLATDIRGLVEKYGGGAKLRTEGERRNMKYLIG